MRLTRSFLAIVASVSPRLTVCNCIAFSWPGAAAARPSRTWSAVPCGTLIVYSPFLTGVVQRRNSGLSCLDVVHRHAGPFGDAAQIQRRRHDHGFGQRRRASAMMSKPYCAGFFAMMTAARIIGT